MQVLIRIFGWPHEFLHVLALWLTGRRAVQFTQTHVDIPDDLSTGQYVFVAGLPALVFWSAALWGAQALLSARSIGEAALWFGVTGFFGIGVAGTLGDLLLIFERIMTERSRPPDEE
jgi:hypothetical protein